MSGIVDIERSCGIAAVALRYRDFLSEHHEPLPVSRHDFRFLRRCRDPCNAVDNFGGELAAVALRFIFIRIETACDWPQLRREV